MSIPSMVAVPVGTRCVVRRTAKAGIMSVGLTAWCGAQYEAASGVDQVPNVGQFCQACEAELARVVDVLGGPPSLGAQIAEVGGRVQGVASQVALLSSRVAAVEDRTRQLDPINAPPVDG